MKICNCSNNTVACVEHFHCLQLENSLEMDDEEPTPGPGNLDSTSSVYRQSYGLIFFAFLPQLRPLFSNVFPDE